MHRHVTSVCLIGGFLLGGCALAPEFEVPVSVSPMFEQDESYIHAPDDSSQDQSIETGPYPLEPMGPWWQRFGAPGFATMTETLVDQNLDLAQARARIKQAKAQRWKSTGAFLPSLSGSGDATRTSSETPTGRVTSDSYSLGGAISWAPGNVFNWVYTDRAFERDFVASGLEAEALGHTLIANFAKAWVGAVISAESLIVALDTVESFGRTLTITERRYESGIESVNGIDVQLARQNLSSAKADVHSSRVQLERNLLAMDVLLGQRPGVSQLDLNDLPQLLPLEPVPLGLPADLLERRPDVKAREMRMRAALQRVGLARANLFPQLDFSIIATLEGSNSSELFDLDSYIARFVAGLTAPIFQGGQLHAQVRLSKAVAEELAASYALTALSALRDVEQSLVEERGFRAQFGALEQNLDEALLAETLANERYRAGRLTLLLLLETQRRRTNAQNRYFSAKRALLEARINLYLALGGAWTVLDENVDSDQTTKLEETK